MEEIEEVDSHYSSIRVIVFVYVWDMILWKDRKKLIFTVITRINWLKNRQIMARISPKNISNLYINKYL